MASNRLILLTYVVLLTTLCIIYHFDAADRTQRASLDGKKYAESQDVTHENAASTQEGTRDRQRTLMSKETRQIAVDRLRPHVRDFHIIQLNSIDLDVTNRMPDDVTRVIGTPQSVPGRKRPMKTILLWNQLHYTEGFAFGLGHEPFLTHGCPVSDCAMTTDKRILQDADAIVFHTRDMQLLQNQHQFPKRANQRQLFAFYNLEASIRVGEELTNYSDVFNLTMTYRLDSDIPVRHVTLWPRPTSTPYVPLTAANMATKTKMAMWIISHCGKDGSNRWEYGQELAKHINLHIFGACGKPGCPKGKKSTQMCLEKADRQYKFYLSLENSVCKDYVTEKLYKALSHNVVPIVIGGLDYKRELPPKSVINIMDYNSPKALADYLIYLDQNDEEYLKYFEWKTHYVVDGMRSSKRNAFCHLCQILHNENYPARTRFDAYKWWNEDGQCTSEEVQAQQLGLRP